jgi:hypothetical protein
MRAVVFRVLAGLLAVGFAFVLTAGKPPQGLRDLVMMWGIALMFALYSLFGPAPAEWVLMALFGTGGVKREGDGQGQR